MRNSIFATLGAAALLCAAGPVSAQGTWYTSEALFLARLTGSSVDTYSDLNGFYSGPLSRLAGPNAYTVGAANGLYSGLAGGSVRTLGNNHPELVQFNFTANAFGGWFNVTDIAFFYTPGFMQFLASDSSTYNLALPPVVDVFLGYISNSSLTGMTMTPSGGRAGVSSFRVGSGTNPSGAVPEPGEWAAMGILGAGLTGLVLRKRKQA